MPLLLKHPQADVLIEELGSGKREIRVKPAHRRSFMPFSRCETRYPPELIELILTVKGPFYLCDEIMREESPEYLELALRLSILGYVGEEDSRGKSIIDFGSGSGASTIVLARLFPKSLITGVEQDEQFLDLACARAAFYGLKNVNFIPSPDSLNLPAGITFFDYVVLSAVYEHLLPEERRSLLPQLWKLLPPLGILFLNQTPNRVWPFESHTTGLALINYLPESLALFMSRKFSRRIPPSSSWETLLRQGIRGGTEGEIMGILNTGKGRPVVLEPCRLGFKDRIDLWYSVSSSRRLRELKSVMRLALKAVRRISGVTFTPSLDLAIMKEG